MYVSSLLTSTLERRTQDGYFMKNAKPKLMSCKSCAMCCHYMGAKWSFS